MKILLVYCNNMQENAVPMGVSQLISCLQVAGFTVELFDTTFYRWDKKSSMEIRMDNLQFPPCKIDYLEGDVYEALRNKVDQYSPDLIGFSVVEPTFLFSLKLINSIEDRVKKKSIKIAVGGVHAIYAHDTFLNYSLIDYICIGEGEETFIELCRKLQYGEDPSTTDGFIIKTSTGYLRNKLRKPVDLDVLPLLDFKPFGDRFLLKPMMGKTYRTISLELSRGCPYQCTYCGNSWLTGIFKETGKWYRLKSIDKIHREFDAYIRKYDPEFIYKHSESFLAVNSERFSQYMEMYSQYSIPYWIETRPEDISEEKAKALAATNCKRISIGLENGNEGYRRTYLKRHYTNEQVERACAILRAQGISFSMNLIIGFPDETRDMIFDGIRLLKKVRPAGTSIFLFTPYKGCELRKLCEDRGMIDKDFIGGDYFQMEYSLKNNTMTGAELLGLFRTVPLYVQMPESEYKRIQLAESMTPAGDKVFHELKQEYYATMGWSNL